jgi:hypothetical protein
METVHWKTFIGNLWTVGESVGKKYTKKFTDGQSVLKKIYSLYFIGISISKYKILPKEYHF